MSSGTIIHPGIIESITDETIQVKVLSQSACGTCQIKGSCGIAEMEDKIVEIEQDGRHNWKPGDKVMVRMQESLGRKSVLMGYVIPLVVIVVSVIIFLAFLNHEGLAALLSLLMLVPYYLLLYLFRNRLKKEFRFSIEADEQPVA